MSNTREPRPETLHCAHRFGIPESVELSRRIIERASDATTPRFLIDFQSVEQFELRTDGLRRIVALLRSAPALHKGAVAVVAPSDLVFGMGCAWQALSGLAGLRLCRLPNRSPGEGLVVRSEPDERLAARSMTDEPPPGTVQRQHGPGP